MNDYKIRPATQDDFNFITSSWAQSFREHALIDYVIYNKFQNELIRQILKRAITLVACENEENDLILSYIVIEMCTENDKDGIVLHWAYTKTIYRKFGIIRKMLAKLPMKPVYYTHKPTKDVGLIDKLDTIGAKYCPYLSYGELYEQKSSNHTIKPN